MLWRNRETVLGYIINAPFDVLSTKHIMPGQVNILSENKPINKHNN